MFYSHFLMEHGRAGEAIDIIDRARRLDPMSPMLLWLQSEALMLSRSDVAGSERLLRQALDLEGGAGVTSALGRRPSHPVVSSPRACACFSDRRITGARVLRMAWLYLDLDDVEAADRVVERSRPGTAVPADGDLAVPA